MATKETKGVLSYVDGAGDKILLYPAVDTDTTLNIAGEPADAAAVGTAISETNENVSNLDSTVGTLNEKVTNMETNGSGNIIKTYDDLMANTVDSNIAGAVAVKDGFNQLNSSLSQVKTYVGEDGKLHFIDSAGADSVLPFSSNVEFASITLLRNSNSVYISHYNSKTGSVDIMLSPFKTHVYENLEFDWNAGSPYIKALVPGTYVVIQRGTITLETVTANTELCRQSQYDSISPHMMVIRLF